MRLLAISDLHVEHAANRDAILSLPPQRQDWLILAGDVSESVSWLEWSLDELGSRFAKLFWVPGNHELWTVPRSGERDRGEARYLRMVAACRARGVLTPEDPWIAWPADPAIRIAPMFVLYDYSFAPDGIVGADAARAWAAEDGIAAMDEVLLHADPHPSREAWCAARIAFTEARLRDARAGGARLVMINHWPLRRDLVRIPRVPRYVPWCGTRATERWHVEHGAEVVIHGHLHVRATDHRDGVRFEEVSLGYPRDWDRARGMAHYLRRIL
jgi:predicted phosphodiesterase